MSSGCSGHFKLNGSQTELITFSQRPTSSYSESQENSSVLTWIYDFGNYRVTFNSFFLNPQPSGVYQGRFSCLPCHFLHPGPISSGLDHGTALDLVFVTLRAASRERPAWLAKAEGEDKTGEKGEVSEGGFKPEKFTPGIGAGEKCSLRI